MGAYINPPQMSKEAWLDFNGVDIPTAPLWKDIPKDMLAVCLVNNGSFTAAGIAFSESELEVFKYPDGRPKRWYLCLEEDLLLVSKELSRYLGR
jgi:hypothetical protein